MFPADVYFLHIGLFINSGVSRILGEVAKGARWTTKIIAIALFCFMIKNPISFGQQLKGLFQGYQGEWSDVSEQLIALGEATPEDKFTWRPVQRVRSISEVYVHIVRANYLMLNAIGWKTEASILPLFCSHYAPIWISSDRVMDFPNPKHKLPAIQFRA